MRQWLASLLVFAVVPAFAHDRCAFTAERTLDIDPAGAAALRLELTSNDLVVEGVPGLARIEVRGHACASQQAWLADLDMTQARSGGKIVVKPTEHAEHTGWSGGQYAYIDFKLRVPAATVLEVDTHSGDSDIAHVAALTFSSHSGDLKLADVTGAVSAQVGSGDILAHDLGSFALAGSGSGDVTANAIRGEAKVGHVGSGDLHFEDVRGGLHIEAIGSGDLSASRIGGDLTVGSIGSGDIDAQNVAGNLVVKAAGSGSIHHHGVTGQVQVPKRHADD